MKKDKKEAGKTAPASGMKEQSGPRRQEMPKAAQADEEESIQLRDELNTEHPPINPVDNLVNATPNPATDISEEEKRLLERADRPLTDDSEAVQALALDETDGEDPLNASANPSDMGKDLDVPGAELDDANEEIGEEDEENNEYTKPD